MSLKFKTITMRNFQSIGNVTQTVSLDSDGITLILGDNIDLGSNGSRNGTGKTTLVQALAFAIFGVSLTNIKRDNLVNKINQKNMLVSLEFVDGKKKYRIERGRKPAILRFYIDDGLVVDPNSNEAHGESKHTQAEIDKVIGISLKMFKHIIALHSKTTPFLNLRDGEQREIIEELLGITQISQKAEALKIKIKGTKEEIKEQEVRIKTITESNNRIHSHIADLKFKSETWERTHTKKLDKLSSEISQLENIDIDTEIANHSKINEWNIVNTNLSHTIKETQTLEKSLKRLQSSLESVLAQLKDANEHKCPECNQNLHNDKMLEIKDKLTTKKDQFEEDIKIISEELDGKLTLLTELHSASVALGAKPVLIYSSIDEAYGHQRLLDSVKQTYETATSTTNPYYDQIANLSSSGIQTISYEYLNQLTRLKDHQEFLLKLLTNKESFIRQKIIDQNLSFLNNRLNHYLEVINLPHEVVFNSDLTVDIIKLGKEYDFDQLSSGEQNRLVLSLSWAFRDMWETLNQSINVLIIDELIDSGMDSQGMDKALELLRKLAVERNKNILLISHKGDLESRVDRILTAQKENEFTSYVTNE